jgi:hypothetical protein
MQYKRPFVLGSIDGTPKTHHLGQKMDNDGQKTAAKLVVLK